MPSPSVRVIPPPCRARCHRPAWVAEPPPAAADGGGPGTFPGAGRVRRPCAPSGPDSGKPASARPGTPLPSPYAVRKAYCCRPEAAVTGGWEDRELDRAPGGERASAWHQAARRAAPVGGSNRLLSVEELAAYLGVPKKTVYSCWRQWGLRGYRVGRHLRFRQRHVEEWLQTREE